MISELVVSKVEEIEKEETGILEYKDNDNTVPAKENNFNATIQIWGENTTNSVNTVPDNTVLETENTTSSENTITPAETEEPVEETTTSEETTISEETISQEMPENSQESEPEQTAETTQQDQEQNSQLQNIQEEDNFRTQGYIEINENTEDNSEEDDFIIGENYEETLKNISKEIQKIDWSTYLLTGAKANCTQEDLKDEIQKILNNRIKQNHSLVVKLYVSEAKTVKISFEFPENLETFDIEILSKGENEKYLNLSSLRGEENNANGSTVSLYQKRADAVTTTRISMNQISKSKISEKTTISLQTKGTVNSKKYTIDSEVSYSDAEGEFKVQLGNSLNFDVTPEIEDLSTENCLFLDTLPKEELQITVDAIKQKTLEVLREKNRNLNIIDLNNSNLIVEQTEQNTMSEEDRNAKEQAKQALIETISNKMRDYLKEGKNLKIEDLEGLEVPGYQVNLSISSNLAIITVNGYRFNLDSDFNLSD